MPKNNTKQVRIDYPQVTFPEHHEQVWLHPKTWIAGLALLFSILSSIFYLGRWMGESANKGKEAQGILDRKVDKESFIRLQGDVELIRQSVENIKETQRVSGISQERAFEEVNKKLESISHIMMNTNKRK